MSPDFSGAPCIGRAELFESTHVADHHEARELCLGTDTLAACPMLAACDDLLRSELAATRGTQAAGGGPCGTWAGKLLGTQRASGPRGGRPRLAREHGTDRGYYQHRTQREAACPSCMTAHAEAAALKAAV